jgi:hypothetical protein
MDTFIVKKETDPREILMFTTEALNSSVADPGYYHGSEHFSIPDSGKEKKTKLKLPFFCFLRVNEKSLNRKG